MHPKVLEDAIKEAVRAKDERVCTKVFGVMLSTLVFTVISIAGVLGSRPHHCLGGVAVWRLQHVVTGSLGLKFCCGVWKCPGRMAVQLPHHAFQVGEHVFHVTKNR